MKTFRTSLLVNRLLTSLFTLAFLVFAGNTVALSDNETKLNIGDPATGNTIINSGVEYASLTATATQKAVFINWVTASEQNNSHFEVERSLDMKDFKTVAMVLDGFTAGTGKSYKFKEDAGDVRKGKTVYYRLKQIDTDNQVHYSTVMAVQMNTTVTIFPKQEAVTLNSSDNYRNSSTITDILQSVYPFGQILLSKQSTLSICLTNVSVGSSI